MAAVPLTELDRLCVHTITTKPWTVDDILRHYPAAGVKGVSVWRDRFEEREPATLGRQIREAGMEVVSLVRGGFFPSDTEAGRQAAIDDNRRALEEAAQLGAPLVVLVCGAVPGQAIAESLAQIEAGLEAVLPHAADCNVALGIEPLHPLYADSRSAVCTMKTANALAERFDSPAVGVVVDVFHVWWDPDLEAEVKRCGQQGNLLAFHVCDWKENMLELLNDRGLMGEGVIRLREIRGWVEAAGFSGFNEVEIFSTKWWSQNQHVFLRAIIQAYRAHV